MTPQEQIANFIETCIQDTDIFLVGFKLKPTHNYKIYLDSDSGMTLEKCMRINRKLRALIEEAAIYPEGDFSLEVSSPGVDAPLTSVRQYKKNIGRKLEITFVDETEEGIIGTLSAVTDDSITIEKETPKLKGRKPAQQTPVHLEIPMHTIGQAVVVIEF